MGTVSMILIVLFVFLPLQASEKIQIRIWTDKNEYLVREPIIVNYSIKNISDKIIKMTFLDSPFQFKITDQNGITYPSIGSILVGIPYRDSLIPTEEYKNSANITDGYAMINAGEYTCYFENPQGPKDYISPGGRSNIIRVKVKEPTGEEKKALDMFLDAGTVETNEEESPRRCPKRGEAEFLKYQALVRQYPNSVYAPLALREAIWIYFYSKDLNKRRKIIPMSIKLIEDYPDFSDFVATFTELVGTYEILKDKEGAIQTMKELIEKYPNTRISERAEYWLEKIEKWEFK